MNQFEIKTKFYDEFEKLSGYWEHRHKPNFPVNVDVRSGWTYEDYPNSIGAYPDPDKTFVVVITSNFDFKYGIFNTLVDTDEEELQAMIKRTVKFFDDLVKEFLTKEEKRQTAIEQNLAYL